MSYDLILKTPQGTLLPLCERKQLFADFCNETNLDGPCEINDFEMEPSSYEAETLERCLDKGEFTRSDFEAFCYSHGLKPEHEEHLSYEAAVLFLDFRWGQSLFSPSMPCTDDETARSLPLDRGLCPAAQPCRL